METTPVPIKERALRAVEALPITATYEDVMATVYDLMKLEEALERRDATDFIPQDEAERQFEARWQQR